jgi:K+-sensing histidine kinase KdpD
MFHRKPLITVRTLQVCFLAVLASLVTTAVMVVIGRNTLGDAVVALLYLLPISYSTTHWGQAAGICAAITSALGFDFFFIPPFYTFTVGSIEGWFVLVIFLAVAVLIVGRIQYGLSQAEEREREAIFMYELTSALAGLRDTESVSRTLAGQIQQLFQARLVRVSVYSEGTTQTVSVPADQSTTGKPDLVLPILGAKELDGEVCIWKGSAPLPPLEHRLFHNFAIQGAFALERARSAGNQR